MKVSTNDSLNKWKRPKAQSSAHIRDTKSSAYIIGVLVELRRKHSEKNQFSAHLSRGGYLDGGVGVGLWFIDSKKKKNKNGEWEVFLGSGYLEKICPRKGKNDQTITTLLQKAGIVSLVSRGICGLTTSRYRLEKDWLGIYPTKLNDWQIKRLKKAEEWSVKQQYKRRPHLHWLEESLLRVTIPESVELREVMQNCKTEPSARGAMDYLRGYLPPEERKATLAKYAGTIYTPIASLPRGVVKTLLIDGEEVAQLDITSAHPSTIPSMMIEAEKKYRIAGAIQEAARLRDDLESGLLYDFLAAEVGLSREVAKTRFLQALNGENAHTYNDPTFKAFARRFPIAKQVISKIRNGDIKRLNQKMAHTLSKAIYKAIQTCLEYQIPVYPRTDEIVCRKRDAEFVREVLAGYFFDETGVNAKVGKQRVSYLSVWDYLMEDKLLKNKNTTAISKSAPCVIKANALPIPAPKKTVETPILTSHQDIEAHRMAAELMKLHQLGIISGADDPDARFFAKVIHQFHGTIQKQPQIAA